MALFSFSLAGNDFRLRWDVKNARGAVKHIRKIPALNFNISFFIFLFKKKGNKDCPERFEASLVFTYAHFLLRRRNLKKKNQN
jgi:hypothetical protein